MARGDREGRGGRKGKVSFNSLAACSLPPTTQGTKLMCTSYLVERRTNGEDDVPIFEPEPGRLLRRRRRRRIGRVVFDSRSFGVEGPASVEEGICRHVERGVRRGPTYIATKRSRDVLTLEARKRRWKPLGRKEGGGVSFENASAFFRYQTATASVSPAFSSQLSSGLRIRRRISRRIEQLFSQDLT